MTQGIGNKERDPTVLRYFPTGLYTIGLCHYGHKEAFKTIEVAAENLKDAMEKGRTELAPSTVQHICHVGTRPNPEFFQEQDRWIAARFGEGPKTTQDRLPG